EPHRVRQPVSILRSDAAIEAVARARLLQQLGPGVDAEGHHGEIARSEPGQNERRRRHNEDEQHGEDEAARQVDRHPQRTWMVSAAQSTCGGISEGVMWVTRDEVATKT